MTHQFACAICGHTYTTNTTEADANREYLASGQPGSGELRSACDVCYELVIGIATEQGIIKKDTP
jgi:hypothetical protein